MKRTTLSLAAVVAILAVIAGIATLTRTDTATAGPKPVRQVPVQRTEAVCPQIKDQVGDAQTLVSAVSPGALKDPAPGGEATVAETADLSKVKVKPEGVGKPATATVEKTGTPPLTGTATGAYAPGFAVQETTRATLGNGRGLAGVVCTAPVVDSWFVGTSTADGRNAYLQLANSKDTPAQVDVEVYGPDGPIEAEGGRGLTLAPGASQSVMLRTLTPQPVPTIAVHVVSRVGRVSADIRDEGGTTGTDWVPAAGAPGRSLVIPGIPADATSVQLVLAVPGDNDTSIGLEVVGKNSTYKPAANESVHVNGRQVVSVDLGTLTQGEPGALKLTADRADVLAGVRVVRGTGDKTETAFLTATPALTGRSVLADARAGGKIATTVFLSAPTEKSGRVRVSGLSAKGDPAVQEFDIPAGTTIAVPAPAPADSPTFALTVEPEPGSGPVHAARMLDETAENVPMFTVQGFAPAHETVSAPDVRSDIGVLVPQ